MRADLTWCGAGALPADAVDQLAQLLARQILADRSVWPIVADRTWLFGDDETGRVRGLATSRDEAPATCVLGLVLLDPGERDGRVLARGLAQVEAQARALGYRRLVLEVRTDRGRLRDHVLARGYHETGSRAGETWYAKSLEEAA